MINPVDGIQLPEKINVCGIEFSVFIVDEILDENNRILDGEISYEKARIRIRSSLSNQIAWQVLMHEIVHAISVQFRIPIKEGDVDKMAYGIMGTYQSTDWNSEKKAPHIKNKQEEK